MWKFSWVRSKAAMVLFCAVFLWKILRKRAVAVTNSFRRGWKSLRDPPRELWMALAIKMLEAYAFGATALVLVRFLSGDLGLSDTEAGWAYGLFTTLIGIYSMAVGVLVDKLGVKRSLVLGTALLFFSRVTLTFAPSNAFVFLALFGLMPIGQALGLPVLATGLKRYTNKKSRSYAFSLFHSMLNVGAFVAASFSDYAKSLWGSEGLSMNFGSLGSIQLPVYRAIFFTSIGATAIMFVIALFVREVKVTEEGEVVKFFPERVGLTTSDPLRSKKWWILLTDRLRLVVKTARTGRAWQSLLFFGLLLLYSRSLFVFVLGVLVLAFLVKHFKALARPVWKWVTPFGQTVRDGAYLRLLLFLVLLMGVRALSSSLNGFFPSYFERELGENARPGMINAINTGMVVFLAPALAFVAVRFGVFRTILIGTVISAVSVFFLTLGASVSTAVAFVVLYSIGEAIWYPRLQEYVSTTAPEGREGTFISMIALPMFFAKMGVAGLYGHMLATCCPAKGPKDSELMWQLVGVMALASPAFVYIFRRVIDKRAKTPSDVTTTSK